MSFISNPFDNDVYFGKSIIINTRETSNTQVDQIEPYGLFPGQIRYNKSTHRFEGFHDDSGTDVFGNHWRTFTIDVASASNLGGVKIGQNLLINPATGVLSSIASGTGRSQQLVITVSPLVGVADFTDINTAITQDIGTPAGGYIDGALTSLIGSPPSPTYPFIILLAPGVHSYSSNIILPPYVSLVGEGYQNSVLQFNSVNNDNLLTLDNGCLFSGINLQLGNNLTGNIFTASAHNKNNILIDNILIQDLTNNLTANIRGFSITDSSNVAIQNSKINIANQCNTLECIHLGNSVVSLTNNQITVSSIMTQNEEYGIYMEDNLFDYLGNQTTIQNCTIELTNNSSPNNSIGISATNSYTSIYNSIISARTASTSNGIAIYSNNTSFTPFANYIANAISLIHNDNNTTDDYITSNSVDLSGFHPGSIIQIIDFANNTNNCFVRVGTANSTVITLERYHLLETHLADSNPITLEQLNSIEIKNCKLYGDLSSVKSTGLGYINLVDTQLRGGAPDIYGAYFTPTYPKIITVANDGSGDFRLPSEALNYISSIPNINTSSNDTQTYLVQILPGIYNETNNLIIPSYTTLSGDNKENTSINFQITNGNCIQFNNTTNYSNIQNLSITNTCNNAGPNSNISTLIYLNASNNCNIKNNNLYNYSNSNDNYAILILNANNIIISDVNIILDSNLVADYTSNNFGIKNIASNITTINTSINVKYGLTKNIGYYFENIGGIHNQFNQNLHINTSDNDGANYGIYLNNDTVYPCMFEINNGSIIGASTGTIYFDSSFNTDYFKIILNNVRFNNNISALPTNSTVSCNNCFYVDPANPNNYIPLNHFGQIEYTSGNFTNGDYAGTYIYTGSNNTITGVNTARHLVVANDNTIYGYASGEYLGTGDANTLLGSNQGQNING